MKGLFLYILLSIICIQPTLGQSFSFGYRSHFGGQEAYQNVIRYYNDNRPWLSKSLSPSTYMHGYELGFGGSTEKFGFSFLRIYAQFNKTRAQGTINGQNFQRIVRTRMFGLECFDFWYTPIHFKKFNIGGGIMPLGLGVYRIRAYFKGEKSENIALNDTYNDNLFSLFFNSYHMYFNPHIDLTLVSDNKNSFQLQLFYSVGPKREYDLYYLNQTLNPTTYTNFSHRTLMKINNWGLKLLYSF